MKREGLKGKGAINIGSLDPTVQSYSPRENTQGDIGIKSLSL